MNESHIQELGQVNDNWQELRWLKVPLSDQEHNKINMRNTLRLNVVKYQTSFFHKSLKVDQHKINELIKFNNLISPSNKLKQTPLDLSIIKIQCTRCISALMLYISKRRVTKKGLTFLTAKNNKTLLKVQTALNKQ